MGEFRAVFHMIVYGITYKYRNRLQTLNMEGRCTQKVFFVEFWKELQKAVTFARNSAILPKFGVFKALHLTIDTDYHFDTFRTSESTKLL